LAILLLLLLERRAECGAELLGVLRSWFGLVLVLLLELVLEKACGVWRGASGVLRSWFGLVLLLLEGRAVCGAELLGAGGVEESRTRTSRISKFVRERPAAHGADLPQLAASACVGDAHDVTLQTDLIVIHHAARHVLAHLQPWSSLIVPFAMILG